jgi:hypothetical protein
VPKTIKCIRRVPCEFCERKFVDETSRDRHSRELHRKAFNLVKELRATIQKLKEQLPDYHHERSI